MDEMFQLGLFINDLSKFDGSSEMLITETEHNNQLQKAFETVNIFEFISYASDKNYYFKNNFKATRMDKQLGVDKG